MKKKVLIIAHHLTIGGAQISLINALNNIDYNRFDVTLYVRKNRTEIINKVNSNVEILINNDKTKYYRKPKSLLYFLFRKNKLAEYIRSCMCKYEFEQFFKFKNYDTAICYVNGYTADILKNINAKKKYMFYHISTLEDEKFHSTEVFPYIDGIIAVNENVKVLLQKWFPAVSDNIYVINNFIDFEAIRKKNDFNFHSYTKLDRNKPILCTCGRFVKVKGFDLAVECAHILKEQGLNFIWYFVGDGPERNNIEKQIQSYHLENNIILTGMQENPHLYVNKCHIYVQPSYEDAQPLTIIESFILCKPVIATRTEGGQNLVKTNFGLLSDINAISLSHEIFKLVSDTEKYQCFVNNLKSINYDSKKEEYFNKINSLLNGEF